MLHKKILLIRHGMHTTMDSTMPDIKVPHYCNYLYTYIFILPSIWNYSPNNCDLASFEMSTWNNTENYISAIATPFLKLQNFNQYGQRRFVVFRAYECYSNFFIVWQRNIHPNRLRNVVRHFLMSHFHYHSAG